MLYTQKSLPDYNRMVLKTQFKYYNEGGKSIVHHEELTETSYTMITNGMDVTILIYNYKEQCILENSFNKLDVDTFNKLTQEVIQNEMY